MKRTLSKILDLVSEFLAVRKGLLPLLGILFVILNLLIQFLPGGNILKDTDLLLHIGVIISVIGLMLAWAL